MEALPSDILFSLAIHLDLPDLLQFCSSSNRINNILCKREPIWRYKLQQDFLNDLTNFASLSKTPKELYILLWKLRDLKQQLNLKEVLLDFGNLDSNLPNYKWQKDLVPILTVVLYLLNSKREYRVL